MIDSNLYDEVREKIAEYKSITILTHLNPDADTLGTALGIYALLIRDKSKRVEVISASVDMPINLDFLPNHKKIKHKMDYSNSLVISCDCGSIDRLGFNLDSRDIINIDHHLSNTNYGNINVIKSNYASASQVAFELFRELYDINSDSAICFYSALLSDTRYFTTSSMNNEIFKVAQELVELGANPYKIARNFTQRRSLSSLRILEKVLGSLRLYKSAKVATIIASMDDISSSGATNADIDGIVDYAKSLITVEIAIFVIETNSGVRVSMRSKGLDISKVAVAFGGGGHRVASGFSLEKCGLKETIDTILIKIEELGLIHEI
ncbi:MAG: bifunctional oligoribonuclease/PAP phosphatase NrnA [Sulfurovum sp.]